MINNKKGLSMIVSTLIIILLVLVAIGIIWTVVRNLISQGTETVNINSKCLEVNLQIVSADCSTGTSCDVVIERGTGGDSIDGVRIVVSDGTSNSQNDGTAIPALGITTTNVIESETGDITNVYAAAFFEDSAGEAQLCPKTPDFTEIILLPVIP